MFMDVYSWNKEFYCFTVYCLLLRPQQGLELKNSQINFRFLKLWHCGDQRYETSGTHQTIAEIRDPKLWHSSDHMEIRDMKLWHSSDHSGDQSYETLALLRPRGDQRFETLALLRPRGDQRSETLVLLRPRGDQRFETLALLRPCEEQTPWSFFWSQELLINPIVSEGAISIFWHRSIVLNIAVLQSLYVAVVAEWLRRLTRNQIPSGSAGSNPADCGTPFICGQEIKRLHTATFRSLRRAVWHSLASQLRVSWSHVISIPSPLSQD